MCAGSPLAGVPKGTPTGELHLTVLACSEVEMDPGRVKLGPAGMLALLPNRRRGCVKTPGCGQRGGPPTSDPFEIVTPERNVRVGILEDRHRCEFSHRRRLHSDKIKLRSFLTTLYLAGEAWR